jgi:hypothetical protein
MSGLFLFSTSLPFNPSAQTKQSGWDNFFQSNLTPFFFIETLADLEKQFKSGKSPEDVVGDIALKTPDRDAYPNAHHQHLVEAELYGLDPSGGWTRHLGRQEVRHLGRTKGNCIFPITGRGGVSALANMRLS